MRARSVRGYKTYFLNRRPTDLKVLDTEEPWPTVNRSKVEGKMTPDRDFFSAGSLSDPSSKFDLVVLQLPESCNVVCVSVCV